jgi:putative addiction module killer protein
MTQRRSAIYFRDQETGKEPAKLWLESLRDEFAKAKIYVRIQRAESGNFGDHKSVGEGLMEMRIPIGPGYRVYYTLEGKEIILLILGGDKSTQRKDIALAKKYLKAHEEKAHGKRK